MATRSRHLTAAAAIALGLAGALAGQAGAITTVTDEEPLVDNSQNIAHIQCPTDQLLLGGGVYSSAASGRSVVVGSAPDNPDEWEGVVDSGDVLAFDVMRVYGICQGGNVASKLKFREKTASIDAGTRKRESVRCPGGYKVTGGGVTGAGTFSTAKAEITRPVDGGTAWEGRVNNFSASPQQMTVHAICATGRFARSLEYRSEPFTIPAGGTAFQERGCGGRVTGGGALVREATTNLVGTWPTSDRRWKVQVDATVAEATSTIYAICRT